MLAAVWLRPQRGDDNDKDRNGEDEPGDRGSIQEPHNGDLSRDVETQLRRLDLYCVLLEPSVMVVCHI